MNRTEKLLAPRLGEIRRGLRTDKSLLEIALDMGVPERSLVSFVKRNQLCDLRERRRQIERARAAKAEQA